MRIFKGVRIYVIVLLVGTCASSCAPVGLAPLRKELERYNYALYEPPRSNWGPGWTFHLLKTYDGRTVPSTVCERIYSDITPTRGKLSLPEIKTKTTVGVNFAIELLENLLMDSTKAEVNLSSLSSVTITWGEVWAEEIPKEQQFTKEGKIREMNQACYYALQDLKEKGELEGKVFVVQGAVLTTGFKYTFARSAGGGLTEKIDWREALTVKPGVNVTREGDLTLIFREPRYIGFNAAAILDWIPNKAFTGPRAEVRVKSFKAEELKELLE